MSIQATLIFGDPTSPCSGSGICDLQAATGYVRPYPLLGGCQIGCTVSVDSNNNIVIDIPANNASGKSNLMMFQTMEPALYNLLISVTKTNPTVAFYTDYKSDFYIDPSLNSLWTGSPAWVKIPGTAAYTITSDGNGGWNITAPVDTTPPQGGWVGVINGTVYSNLSTSHWNAGLDFYNNLVFTNQPNLAAGAVANNIIYGYNGNINCCNSNAMTRTAQLGGMLNIPSIPLPEDYIYYDIGSISMYWTIQSATDEFGNNLFVVIISNGVYPSYVLLYDNPNGTSVLAINNTISSYGTDNIFGIVNMVQMSNPVIPEIPSGVTPNALWGTGGMTLCTFEDANGNYCMFTCYSSTNLSLGQSSLCVVFGSTGGINLYRTLPGTGINNGFTISTDM